MERKFQLEGIARIASEVTGRPIKRIVVTDETYRESLLARQVPAIQADMLVGLFRASRKGEFATVHPALEQVLGRTPQTVRDVLASE